MRCVPPLAIAAAVVAACSSERSSPPPPPPAPANATASASVSPPPPPPSHAPARSGPVEKMFAQLAKEKAERPAGGPKVEAVLAAIDRAGVKLEEQKQVLALTARARYCVLATSDSQGLTVVVCEHGSAAEADAAMKYLLDRFQKVTPTRTFTIKGSTSIQVVDRPDHPLPDARRRIDGALATL